MSYEMTFNFLESLYKDLLSITSEIVVKRKDLADAGETINTSRDFDLYLACITGTRHFYSFPEFDEDILLRYVDPSTAFESKTRRNVIPENVRDYIIRDQAQRVLARFEERNGYYRTLMGLPPLNDHRWVYVKNQKDIPSNVPIHLMTVEQIARLEIYGELKRIQ
ncbi:MAG: hypothetical protein K2F99_02780, partial [Muribaculaceae bacterium]|nr:hypothetical protein [Muribaculaceae bacterium]